MRKASLFLLFLVALFYGCATQSATVQDERNEQMLLDKLRSLPAERLAEVEDFIDFLRQRDADRGLTRAAAGLSEDAFAEVWDNPEDAEYDHL